MPALTLNSTSPLTSFAPRADAGVSSRALARSEPCIATRRALIERLAARVSASCDEIAPFESVDAALNAVVASFIASRRLVIAQPCRETLGVRASAAARSTTIVPFVAGSDSLDALVQASRDAEVVLLTVPFLAQGSARSTLGPRELLALRSRAPKPLIVLDLLDEEYARTPLTQPALLLPGTVVVRGFGDLWRDAGATSVAPLAFIAGPRDLIAPLRALPLAADPTTANELCRAACNDLDLPDIERRVAQAALSARLAASRACEKFVA